jgi:hypothetical protein
MKLLLLATIMACTYLAPGLIALSQKRHWHNTLPQVTQTQAIRWGLRMAGIFLMLLAFTVALLRDGPAFGSVLFVVASIANCLVAAISINLYPGWFTFFAICAARTGNSAEVAVS